MKNKIKKVLLGLLIIYTSIIVIYQISCDASYTGYNLFGEYEGIKYNGSLYVEGSVAKPYELVHDEDYTTKPQKYYVRQNLWFDFVFPFRYFEFYCESFDDNENFIINQPNQTTSFYFPFIREDFSYPTVENNEVAEIWMSNSSNDEHDIKDKATVDKIVECAKSGGIIPLDKDIVEYIKAYSWDKHCFNLKYAGYPLVEQFHIEETEDGRYIVDQYTAEEYDTIYYQDEAHQ